MGIECTIVKIGIAFDTICPDTLNILLEFLELIKRCCNEGEAWVDQSFRLFLEYMIFMEIDLPDLDFPSVYTSSGHPLNRVSILVECFVKAAKSDLGIDISHVLHSCEYSELPLVNQIVFD